VGVHFDLKAAKGIAVTTRKFIFGLFCCLALATTATLGAAELERVDYRLTEWKSVHFDDAQQAASYMKTFKAIKVECKQESHGDHIDVSFRSPKWQTLTLKTHAEAHQWQDFLKKIGFETKHAH
jgi:hypothetical protein